MKAESTLSDRGLKYSGFLKTTTKNTFRHQA